MSTDSTQKRDVQLKADISSTVSENGNDQSGMNISPATNEKTRSTVRKSNKTSAFLRRTWKAVKKSFQKNRVDPFGVSAQSDPEPSCVPDPEAEDKVDLVDEEQLCAEGQSGAKLQVTAETPKTQVTTDSTQKRDVQLKADISSTVSENGNDQSGMNKEKTKSKVMKSNKICAFFQTRWKCVKKSFQKSRVEPIEIPAQPDPEPSCVPDPEAEAEVDLVDSHRVPDPEAEAEVELVDAHQLCVAGPNDPEPQVKTETQVTTELPMLHNVILNIFQLERRMCKCRVMWTPIAEVWPSVFMGNEETAMDRVKLKEMGITHILNTAAYKEYPEGKINTKAEYYQEMNITYYGVLVTDEHRFDISKDLFPASEFIHKVLSNTENKLLVHCIDGVSRSATFFLAYLMIHHEMLLEDAIDHVIDKRWIRPNRDFLKQLITLNSNLVTQGKLQLRKPINTDKTKNGEDAVAHPVPEPLCEPGPSKPKPEPQVTKELSVLESHVSLSVLQLQDRVDEYTLYCTPVTEVWPSVFMGNEETAMDRVKLKEMGITHILNTAAYKEYPEGKINTKAEYYQEMNITYYGVLVTDEHRFDISKDLFPASEFIHKVLSNTENKLLVHCIDGVSRSATFFLAYLMIHHEMLLEDAIDHVIDKRWIRPNRDFLKQLITLNSNLVTQGKLQLRKPINTDKTKNGEDAVAHPVPEPLCEPGPSKPKPEPQVTKELSVLESHVSLSVLQLQDRVDEYTLYCTPVTEVWPNVFIGNEETARNRAKLKGMGITHILNAAAVEKSLKVLFEIPSKKSLKGKVNTGEAYYQGRSINYYDVPAEDKCSFNISEYFFPAAQFIHQALSNPENKVLVHCKKGLSRSATLVLAYLMIYHDMMVEDAIDHVMEARDIRPNIGFLKQLTILNSNLKSQRILQLKKQIKVEKETD
ncbi:uncharacterized protein LOC127972094 isoform X3 [Carassius gibelio]|uniref:uncharacterized protein LOC127972094 isoform X2 n=1 Tax=Carassius gibelio TaxID=101364 RepID=UPI002277C77D|nr:uncharacterized protein LOC127972094 isoform X2 [Carassius gibelio]XP_052431359.1 uncharacterized protein LOC127972094 isoform X3 [Carassius gibelio]